MAASRDASPSTSTLSYKLTEPHSSFSETFPLSVNPQDILEKVFSAEYMMAGATLSLVGDDLSLPSTLAICQGFSEETTSSMVMPWEMQSNYFASKTDLVFRVLRDTFSGEPSSTLSPKKALEKLKELSQSDQKYPMLKRIFHNGQAPHIDELEQGKTPLGEILSSPVVFYSKQELTLVVELLIIAGANIEYVSAKHRSLSRAAASGQALIVRQLLIAGANKEEIDHATGATPLYYAVQEGQLAVVELLLAANANKNVVCKDGTTPLHVAAHMGRREIIELLLNAETDTNTARKNGATPLYYAAQQGHREVVELLLAVGASNNIICKDTGNSPADAARRNDHSEIVSLLNNWVPFPPLLSSSLLSIMPSATIIQLKQYLCKFSYFDKKTEGVFPLYQKVAQEQRFFNLDQEILLSFITNLFQDESVTDEDKTHYWLIVAVTLIERMAENIYSHQSLTSTLDFCMKSFVMLSNNKNFPEIFELILYRVLELLKNIVYIRQKTVIFNANAIADYRLVASLLINYQDEHSVILAKLMAKDVSFAKVLLNYDAEIDLEAWNTEEGRLALHNLSEAIKQEREDFCDKLAKEEGRLMLLAPFANTEQLTNKILAIRSLLATLKSPASAASSSTDISMNHSWNPLLKVLRDWAKDNPNQYKILIASINVVLMSDTGTKELFETPFYSIAGQEYKKAYQAVFEPQKDETITMSPNHPNSLFYHRQVVPVSANFQADSISETDMTYDTAGSAQELQFIL